MRTTSKTGLLPTLKKSEKIENRGIAVLEMPKIVVPAPFTLRPFAGIYNPFPYGCSVLCNHPSDVEAKSIVKKAKDAWSSEGKSLVDLEELALFRNAQEKEDEKSKKFTESKEKLDNVPEELFRKYTETDSRPVTPTPTLASVVTKSLKSRRCMTPDPTAFTPAREKMLLVLDLRRSHSQETVCWMGSHTADINFESKAQDEPLSRATSRSCVNGPVKKRKNDKKKPAPPSSATASSLKTQTSKDSDTKTQHSSTSQSPSKGSVLQEQEPSQIREVSSENSFDDTTVVKRRGKKTKKGKKSGKDGVVGEKEFQGIPDPGETQVSALESDSKEGSSRPSLTGEEKQAQAQPDEATTSRESKPECKEEKHTSFLSQDTLKGLQRQLDQEVVDSELNAKVIWTKKPRKAKTVKAIKATVIQLRLIFQRKIALEEALRLKKTPKYSQQGEEMKNLKKNFQIAIKDSEKWLSIPRVFTRRSARFELPMDSRTLNNMTPTEYVATYVFASAERLVLYNHVFNLFKEDPEDDEERERVLLGKNVMQALGKIMGRPLTDAEAKDFQNLLNWKDQDSLDFRTFSGISATCERVMSPQFCSKMLTQKEDPRHEIERADFESLDEKLLRLNPNRNLVRMLKCIRDV